MITKKEFSQALTDNASVAAGLVPIVAPSVNGKATPCFYKVSFTYSLNRVFRIVHKEENQSNVTLFIEVITIQNTYDVNPEITFITASLRQNEIAVKANNLIKLTDYGIKIYISGNDVFFSITKNGGHVHFIGANVRVTEMELPKDAEEITVL